MKVATLLRLIIYYGFAAHLPASANRYTRWTRPIRRWIASPLFRRCGANVNIERGASFGSGRLVEIGNNSGLGVDCRLLGTVSIGDNVMIGPEVMFITSAHAFDRTDIPMISQGYTAERPIVVHDDVWIGARCTILPGVEIGEGSIIGACSVVTRSFPRHVIIAGNPARVVKERAC